MARPVDGPSVETEFPFSEALLSAHFPAEPASPGFSAAPARPLASTIPPVVPPGSGSTSLQQVLSEVQQAANAVLGPHPSRRFSILSGGAAAGPSESVSATPHPARTPAFLPVAETPGSADDSARLFPASPAAGSVPSRGGQIDPRELRSASHGQSFDDVVRSHVGEIDRRERKLAEGLAGLDHEQRQLRLLRTELEGAFREREESLQQREAELSGRLTESAALVATLRQREQELDALRQELEQNRSGMGVTLQQELDVERSSLRHARSMAEAERTALAEQTARLRDEHQATLRQLRREHESERRRLRVQVGQSVDADKASLDSEREEWAAFKAAQEQRLQHEQQLHQEAMRRVEAELAEERHRLLEEVRQLRGGESSQLAAERAQLARERDEWQIRQTAAQTELRQQRQEIEKALLNLESSLGQRRTELEADARRSREAALVELRRSWDEERQQLHQQFFTELESERRRLTGDIAAFEARREQETASFQNARDAQDAVLKQARQELLQDKQQFHEEQARRHSIEEAHLLAVKGQFESALQTRIAVLEQQLAERTAALESREQAHTESAAAALRDLELREQALATSRDEVARQQQIEEARLADLRRTAQSEQHSADVYRQRFRHEAVHAEERLRLRQRQAERFREMLTEREKSVEREEAALEQTRSQIEAELAADRENLKEASVAIAAQRESLVAERLRADEQAVVERQKLEERAGRLEQLRRELEQAGLRNIELRVAAEEVLAELTTRLGEEEGLQRVEEVRAVIAEHYRTLHAAADGSEEDRSHIVAASRRELEEQAARLRSEREAFARRMQEHQQQLQQQQARLDHRVQEWQQREASWRSMRDDWLREKLDAEHIIRGLLDELTVT